MSGSRYITPVVIDGLQGPAHAARSPAGGLVFGGSASRALTEKAGPNVYGGDWFQRWRVVTPATRDGVSRQIGGLYGSASNDNNRVGLRLAASGYAFQAEVRDSSATRTVALTTLAAATAYDLWLVFVHGTKSWTLYANGVEAPLASGTFSGDVASAYDAISALQYVQVGNSFAGNGQSDCTILACEYGNVALTGAEVAAVSKFGWSALTQYVHAEGGGRVIYEGDYSVGTGGASVTGNVSLAGNQDGVTDGTTSFDDCLMGTPTGSSSSRFSFPAASAIGRERKLLRTEGRVYVPATNATVDRVVIQRTTVQGGNIIIPATAELGKNGWESWSATYFGAWPGAAGQTPGVWLYSGTTNTSLTPGDVVYVRDVKFTTLGLCGSWDFSEGAGYQQRDLSGGGVPMLLSASGVERLAAGDFLQVKATAAHASANNQQILGQAILPDLGWRLQSIVAVSDADVTVDVGNASGGSQIVAAAALTAGVPADLAIVAGAAVPTTVNLWSASSGAANVTYTATYVRTD